jgi:hypothetical protein
LHNYTSLFTEFVFYQRNDDYSFFGVQAKVVVTKYQLCGIHDEFVMEANRICRLVIFNRVKTLVNVVRIIDLKFALIEGINGKITTTMRELHHYSFLVLNDYLSFDFKPIPAIDPV